MNELLMKNISSTSWDESIIGCEDPTYRRNFNFRLRKRWIDHIIDELDENLKLLFRVLAGVHNLRDNHLKREISIELSKSLHFEADVMVDCLKNFHTNFKFSRYEIPERYQHILQSVQKLRRMLPIKTEVLQPYKRKRTQGEKLQWITGILASKAKIRNLKRKIHAMQSAIDETKLELFMLTERSPREIQDIIEQSELELIDVKQSGDRRFAQLQEETSKKVLDLDQMKEYCDLVSEHDQKRRKITKLTVQLQLWIKQYDKFVGEPMKELNFLEEEVDKFVEWKETVYDPQEDKLNQLKVSVELLESELIEERVEKFRIEHAARVLQRAWRKVLEKRKNKKKRKKGKKGKKGKGKKMK